MRFKVLVLAALVAAFSIGFYTSNANAQLPDGIMTMIELTGDTGYWKYNDDYAQNGDPYGGGAIKDGKGKNDFAYAQLNAGAGIKWIAKKGNVLFIANLSAWNMAGHPTLIGVIPGALKEDGTSGSSFWNGTYTDPNGNFSLLVGMDVLPFSTPNFNAPFRWDLGGPYGSFNFFPYQVRLNVKGFYLSIMKSENGYDKVDGFDGRGVIFKEYGTKTTIPTIVVGYEKGHLVLQPIWFNIGFVYNQYKIADSRLAGAEDGKTIKAYRLGVGFKYDGIVPKVLDIIAHGYYGINANQLGMGVPNVTMAAMNSVEWSGADNNFKDTTGYGGHAGIAIKLGIHKVCGGIGYDQQKTDISGRKADKDIEYWGNFWYYLDSNYQIIPSVIYRDHMKDQGGVKQGTEVIYGICWKVNA